MSKQKKIACINDISGLGKCSLTVAIPIISALKCQCCPLPTSVLSSQTGYPKFSFVDLTDSIEEYIDIWQELRANFDTIYSGFLGSSRQIKLVENLIKNNPDSFVIVDPVLADNGKMFPIFTDEDVVEMRELVTMADLITPNITEANLLSGRKIDNFDYKEEDLLELCRDLSKTGPSYVITTGFEEKDSIYNICYDRRQDSISKIGVPFNRVSFSGTGDIFTSIVSALITRGFELEKCVSAAVDFIYKSVNYTVESGDFDRNDGILFEYFLDNLTQI